LQWRCGLFLISPAILDVPLTVTTGSDTDLYTLWATGHRYVVCMELKMSWLDFDQMDMVSCPDFPTEHHSIAQRYITAWNSQRKTLQALEFLVLESMSNQVYSESHIREMLRPRVRRRRQPSQQAIITQCNHNSQNNPATACDWTVRRFGCQITKNRVSSNLQLRLAGGAHAVTPGRDWRLGRSKQRRAYGLLVC
jgi:hypothetical protein